MFLSLGQLSLVDTVISDCVEHIKVHRNHSFRIETTYGTRDRRALEVEAKSRARVESNDETHPIAALACVFLVSKEINHKSVEELGGIGDVPSVTSGQGGEDVTRKRWRDDMEAEWHQSISD